MSEAIGTLASARLSLSEFKIAISPLTGSKLRAADALFASHDYAGNTTPVNDTVPAFPMLMETFAIALHMKEVSLEINEE